MNTNDLDETYAQTEDCEQGAHQECLRPEVCSCDCHEGPTE